MSCNRFCSSPGGGKFRSVRWNSTLQKPGSLATNQAILRQSFNGWGRMDVRRPGKPKKVGFFDFIFGGFTHNLYSKNHYITVYIPISNGEGGPECRRIYFLWCAPTGGRAGKEGRWFPRLQRAAGFIDGAEPPQAPGGSQGRWFPRLLHPGGRATDR